METLSHRQQEVYQYICHFQATEGYPPTYTDIAKAFKFSSTATVRTYLEYLEKKGYIERIGKARGIKIKNTQHSQTPIIGKISAGNPIYATEDIAGSIQELALIQHKSNRFALTVQGDSMINAGIHNQDIAIIEQTKNIKNNDIVAICIEDEATLKRIEITNDSFILKPENDNYSPITINKKDNHIIIGKLSGVIRQY